jgi:hypothetical protein
MKTVVLLMGCCFLLATACDSHGPLEGIWSVANDKICDYIVAKELVDTVDICVCLKEETCPDSVTSSDFSILPVEGAVCTYQLALSEKDRLLHPIHLWKGEKKITLIVFESALIDSQRTETNIKVKGMLNNRLLFDCAGKPSDVFVLWQNVLLPHSFLVFTNDGFATRIPNEAKMVKHSELRIFLVTDSVLVLDSRVALLYGVPES